MTAETVGEIWAEILRDVPGMLARSLEKSNLPAIFAPNTLVLRFPPAYNVAKELCQDASNLAAVESALKKRTGQAWLLRIENPAEEAPAEPSNGRGNVPAASLSGRRNSREEAEKIPLVKKALDVLGATLQRVDEGFGSLPPAPPNGQTTSEEGES